MITMGVLLGAGIGLGLWALLVWLAPPKPSLASLLDTLHAAPKAPPVITTPDKGRWAAKLGRPAVGMLASFGLPTQKRRRDLHVLGRTTDTVLAEKAVLTVAGLLLPSALHLFLLLAGWDLPWQFPFAAGLVCAVGGFWFPDVQVAANAEHRRTAFRHALSAYLNLVRVSLAAGAGVDGALSDAASVGQGWAFTQIRRALTLARLTRATPWSTLAQLGEELDVRELMELASSVSLAGTEGAKVRASLAAKAAAIRTRELAAAEGHAQAATERMSLPVVCLFAAYLLLIGFPAIASVLGSL